MAADGGPTPMAALSSPSHPTPMATDGGPTPSPPHTLHPTPYTPKPPTTTNSRPRQMEPNKKDVDIGDFAVR